MNHQITFLPQNRVTSVADGTSVLEAANWAGVAIGSTCGGRGTCGKCKIRIRWLDAASPADPANHSFLAGPQLAEGWRLACRAIVHANCRVEVPPSASPKKAPIRCGREIALDPNVHKIYLRLAEPGLADQRADVQRVVDALRAEGYEARPVPAVWRALPKLLRDHRFCLTAVICGDELVAVETGDATGRSFGLALDVGTTTIAGAVFNLDTGAMVAAGSIQNSQTSYGADVISRITCTVAREDGLATLQHRVVQSINELLRRLRDQSAVAPENIYEVVAVGNATMLHLLLGISPEPIGVAPFIPVVQAPVTLPAADLGLELGPQARCSTLTHLGAYVGADVVAGVLATNLVRSGDDQLRLYIDVGTNTEIVLASPQRALCTAAPAGPAFEGAQILCGMCAVEGAIDSVEITDDIHLRIIGGGRRPAGICGSGLVSAAAALLERGLLDASGCLARPENLRGRLPAAVVDRLIVKDGVQAFLLSSPEDNIVLTQNDLRALQYAKAAIASGIQVLMSHLGVRPQDLDHVLLAGSFGISIDPASARAIGLVPWVPIDRIAAVGNAAGEGAAIALLSYRERCAANQIPDHVEYLELSGVSEFNDFFTAALAFPA